MSGDLLQIIIKALSDLLSLASKSPKLFSTADLLAIVRAMDGRQAVYEEIERRRADGEG